MISNYKLNAYCETKFQIESVFDLVHTIWEFDTKIFEIQKIFTKALGYLKIKSEQN